VAGHAPNTVVALLYRPGGARLTCGAAVRGSTEDAVRHAVCEAVAARLALSRPRPTSTLQDRDRAAGLAAAAAGERHLRFVTDRIVGNGEPVDSPDDLGALLEAAEAVFGRAPADVTLPQVDGHVVHHLVSRSGEIPETLYGPFLPCPLA
jgi:hypothetical protein